jgi:pimeloyl-ACP methyl ester carboxylesterase
MSRLLLMALAAALAAAGASAQEPLRIAKQGSVEAGGELVNCDTNDGADANNPRQGPGLVHINHVYASYQYPADQKYAYPVLFNPGGGHSARVYDTTPDGREGWLTLFPRVGFAVYGVDRVSSGRSGADSCALNAARLGRIPAAKTPIINRYSAESAWVAFRWGPKYGTFYDDTQFPKDALNAYYPQLLNNYRDAEETPKFVAALAALIDRIDTPVVLQSWSSSGLLIYLTAIARPQRVKGILALEHSADAFDRIDDRGLRTLAGIPIINVIADRTPDRVAGARKFEQRMKAVGGNFTPDVLPEAGIRGNGHTMMLEKNNRVIMDRMVAWMKREVYEER